MLTGHHHEPLGPSKSLDDEGPSSDQYREMVEYFKGFDTTTRKMLEEIQSAEEQHADDLAELLDNLPK